MPNTGEKVERQLRLLLSWREEARRIEREAPAGGMDRAECAALISHIESVTSQFLARERASLEELAGALRTALQEQRAEEERIVDDSAQRGEDETYLSRLNDQISAVRQRISNHNRLLRAQNAADLGGFISLPIEEYPRELDALGLSWRAKEKPARRRMLAYLSPSDRRTLAILPVLILAAVLAVFYVLRWRGDIAFEILPPESPAGTVRIHCENGTIREVTLHAPWPEDFAANAPGVHCGVNLYARMQDAGEFRLFPSTGLGWTYEGEATGTIDPIAIPAGLFAEVFLDLDAIRAAEPGIAAVRLECTKANGAILASFEYAYADE